MAAGTKLTCSLALLLAFGACAEEAAGPDAGEPGPDAFQDPCDPAADDCYPTDPTPLEGDACRLDHQDWWRFEVPAGCAEKRLCIDDRQRFWVDGEPFLPRGVYNGGWELSKVLSNCPAGAACEATTPADEADYIDMLLEAGFNVIMDRTLYLSDALREAIHDRPAMRLAHLLWDDPFTAEGHEQFVYEISEAALDPDIIMWFGPDEVDMWDNWPMAAGIKRILHGSNEEIDALLAGDYRPGADAFLPESEPAADPLGLPFGAALCEDHDGLAVGSLVYDMLLPITYPFTSDSSFANTGAWGTWRVSAYADQGVPMLPVLQMVEWSVPGLHIVRPSPGQIEAQIASAMAHGAVGAFYFSLIGDDPSFAGREGWFAADDVEGWEAFTRMHALQDEMVPVLFASGAVVEMGTHGDLEWRSWELGGRKVFLLVNPTSIGRTVDVDEILQRPEDRYVRSYADCAPFTDRLLEMDAYRAYVLELYE